VRSENAKVKSEKALIMSESMAKISFEHVFSVIVDALVIQRLVWSEKN
jgi:hypothetical protein